MTPAEQKARELVKKFDSANTNAKMRTIFCIDEILEALPYNTNPRQRQFWTDVKISIEQMP